MGQSLRNALIFCILISTFTMQKTSLFILLLLGISVQLTAQSGNHFFDANFVHEIHLTIADTNFWRNLSAKYDDEVSNGGDRIAYELVNRMEIDGAVLDSVGLRFRGLTSFKHASDFKKPFKVDLNEFVKGQKYDGIKKFNLHNGACDPSMLRDFLAYDVLRKTGIKAPRVAHCRLYINNQYWGLYSMIEQIDKTFLKNNFSDGNGDLYKNVGFSKLSWKGRRFTEYSEDVQLRTNENTSEWEDYLELVDIINNATDADFPAAIQNVLNVDNFLKVLAVDISLNNWDSHVQNDRNWYLYHHPSTGLFEWIPWDYNLSMGGDFAFTANPYRPVDLDCFILAAFDYTTDGTSINFHDKSSQSVEEWFWDFGNGTTSTQQNPSIDFGEINTATVCLTAKRKKEGVLCEHTRCKKISVGTSSPEDDFCKDFLDVGTDSFPINWIDYGKNLDLLQDNPDKTLIHRLLKVPEFKNRFLAISCLLLENNFTQTRLTSLIKQQTALIRSSVYEEPYAFFSRDFYEYDVGDGSGGCNQVNIPPLQYFLTQRIAQIEAHLSAANIDCQNNKTAIHFQAITINEFVASNADTTGGIPDEAGEFDDWIELYNNTNETIDLQGYYLTDNFSKPLKWAFPKTASIAAGGYLIIWADKEEAQSGIHAGFKLDKNGEVLMLSYEDGTIIDSLSFSKQETNISRSRIPNGTGDFVEQAPSFNQKNELVSALLAATFSQKEITVFPNPANQYLKIDFGKLENLQGVTYIFRNISGKIIKNHTHNTQSKPYLKVGDYPTGIYFLEIKSAAFKIIKKVILIR